MKIVQFKDVTRTYVTGDHTQDALAHVDLEIEGGTHGIYYESTRENEHMLTDIRFVNCMVHGVRGTHGICVYARSDLTPVQDLTI